MIIDIKQASNIKRKYSDAAQLWGKRVESDISSGYGNIII
jgi:hypothetical protein